MLKLSEIALNFARFLPPIFEEGFPEFSDRHYKTQPTSNDAAKFRGDRPGELGDHEAKEITSAVNHTSAEYCHILYNREQPQIDTECEKM